MKILLTNDDGIEAPGLQALAESIEFAHRRFGLQVVIVAPDRGRSECGHSVTTNRPLVVKQIRPSWYSVDGTPVDCVRVGTGLIAKDCQAVYSGINAGANLGTNLHVSGTFAAAREAAILGIPAMAVSHYRHPDVPKTWTHVPEWTRQTLEDFFRQAVQPSAMAKGVSRSAVTSPAALWNVNLPAVNPAGEIPERSWCDVDPCPIQRTGIQRGECVEFSVDFHNRARLTGSDVDRCFAGDITVSKLDPTPHSVKNVTA